MARKKTNEIVEAVESAEVTEVTATAEVTAAEVPVAEKKEKKFTKQSILRFEKYGRYRDLLAAVLEDNKRYSVDEVDLILKEDD